MRENGLQGWRASARKTKGMLEQSTQNKKLSSASILLWFSVNPVASICPVLLESELAERNRPVTKGFHNKAKNEQQKKKWALIFTKQLSHLKLLRCPE